MGFLPQIVNLQWARTLSAPGQPSSTGSRHPQLCHYYHAWGPALIHLAFLSIYVSPDLPSHLSAFGLWSPHGLIIPFLSLYLTPPQLLKPFHGSLTTSPLYLTSLNILFTFLLHWRSDSPQDTGSFAGVGHFFSNTPCVTKSGVWLLTTQKLIKRQGWWKGKLALLWMLATG